MARSNWIPPLKVTPQPLESTHGIVLRLCERNGLTSMTSFEHATGIKMGHVFAGRHLSSLATILNIPEEDLQTRAFQVQADKPTVVRGQELRKFDIDRKRRRVCMQCLADNPYQQFWWDLNFITHCPLHSITLSERCSCGELLSWRDREIPRCRKCRTGNVMDTDPIPVEAPRQFENWALSRLGVLPAVGKIPILDGLLLRDAVSLVTRVGRLDRHGWAKYWVDSSTDLTQLHEYQEAGFAIIRDDLLLPLFDRIHRQSETLHGTPPTSMEASLGWFWTWFTHAGASALSPEVTQLLSQHFDKRFVIKNPSSRFGGKAGPRSLLGIQELAAKIGTAPAVLREVLVNQKLIAPRGQGAGIVISEEAANWVLDTMSDTIEIKQAQQFLGVGWRSWQILLQRGWVPIHLPPINYGSRSSKSTPFIRRKDLEDWTQTLAAGAPTIAECPADHSALTGNFRHKNVNFDQLMLQVIDKTIPIVGKLDNATGLASLLVKNEDIDHLIFRGGGRYANRQAA